MRGQGYLRGLAFARDHTPHFKPNSNSKSLELDKLDPPPPPPQLELEFEGGGQKFQFYTKNRQNLTPPTLNSINLTPPIWEPLSIEFEFELGGGGYGHGQTQDPLQRLSNVMIFQSVDLFELERLRLSVI